MQPVALALPPTYVFEALRAIVPKGMFVQGRWRRWVSELFPNVARIR
jgi:hypothetical protein